MTELPVAVVGAGPIGLAAAAHLVVRGLPVRVYEAGARVGASLLRLGPCAGLHALEVQHRPAAQALLERHGWTMPPDEDLADRRGAATTTICEPLAATRRAGAGDRDRGAQVEAITRSGIDKVAERGRAERPFRLRDRSMPTAAVRHDLARAVIDASGTWTQPNPIGAATASSPAGEREHADADRLRHARRARARPGLLCRAAHRGGRRRLLRRQRAARPRPARRDGAGNRDHLGGARHQISCASMAAA